MGVTLGSNLAPQPQLSAPNPEFTSPQSGTQALNSNPMMLPQAIVHQPQQQPSSISAVNDLMQTTPAPTAPNMFKMQKGRSKKTEIEYLREIHASFQI